MRFNLTTSTQSKEPEPAAGLVEDLVARGERLAVSVFLVYSSLIAPTSSGIVLLNQYLFTAEWESNAVKSWQSLACCWRLSIRCFILSSSSQLKLPLIKSVSDKSPYIKLAQFELVAIARVSSSLELIVAFCVSSVLVARGEELFISWQRRERQ